MDDIRRTYALSQCLSERRRIVAKESFSITQPSSVLQYELDRDDVWAVRGDTTINQIKCQEVNATLKKDLKHLDPYTGETKVSLRSKRNK